MGMTMEAAFEMHYAGLHWLASSPLPMLDDPDAIEVWLRCRAWETAWDACLASQASIC
jgi:hypothetical protein